MVMPSRGGIISCHITDIAMLYASYLSFVDNGALFVVSERIQQLGDEVFVAVTLPNSSERLPMNGKVVWLNRKAQANRPAGFAVQIGKDVSGQKIKNEVEHLLAGKLDSQQATYTM
ncbi:pilus assembly protein PilZ [Psychrobacter sp. TAE2020]|uniref:PilZ domain-containing protein n=1 Tax=Psychrobacter sp. TAE2020 TaxID=2846762 RepID=UPI001C12644B|nr:PilZ domain-containing protein [Psychrobacter sp. TAE2020]MBU5616043.1 pilus assembly protein PilZ [Psychrobacter sp. TAE2020]